MRKYFSGTNLTPQEQQKPELQIARALVEARQIKHVTQQQLAERTGIAQADISRLENGNSNPTLRTLQRLADGLEMTVQVGFKDPHSENEEPEDTVVEEEEIFSDGEDGEAEDDEYEDDEDYDDDLYDFPFGGRLLDEDDEEEDDDEEDEDDLDDDDIF